MEIRLLDRRQVVNRRNEWTAARRRMEVERVDHVDLADEILGRWTIRD
jgi:hypothetical protein